MVSELTLILPVPPSLNNAYFNVKGKRGGRVLTDEARDFKGRVVMLAYGHALMQHWRYLKGARLAVELALWFPNRQRRDIANCEKLVTDALAEALSFDDTVIDRLLIERKGVDKANPRCVVTLTLRGDGQGELEA